MKEPMTDKEPESDETVERILASYRICKCGRKYDDPNFAYHVCPEKGLLHKLEAHYKAKLAEEE